MNCTRAKLWLEGLIYIGAIAGCSQPAPTVEEPLAARYVSADELQSVLAASSRPVFVEFGVEIGCTRCDELRPQVERLAEQFADRAIVRRVNLHQARPLAAKLGVTVCPTYIAYVDGQEQFRASYPTSGDLLAAQLGDVLGPSPIREVP
jgi:thioredoxin-like negative regulator of GroEL